ncbi:DNA-binding HORMA [Penicillium expansum]|uniref:DNA-binding HORMA n=1 Tax=Penicillium expansum TaxID=27334 RepID=A0A0A2JWB1_PENEN|nr:DNA-binding HORMA [Penicillium expansum]KGO59732.1 DNA-binding HORMA [Penicillium expansum]
MPRSKKNVALEAAPQSGAHQPEIQANKIHRFPVIEQSLELMKITLHMTIASLLFMRGLLPMQVFGERILRANRFHERYTYANFVNGKSKGNFARNRSEYVPIWAIERHMSDEADKLLDLLFTIIANKDLPNKVLESYTFTFDNFGERGTADRLTNGPRMDFVSPHEDRASMRNMIFEGKALIRRLITMCAESPALPNERSLGIHVFYKPECPASYDVHGFADSQDDTIEYPRTSYWERTRRFYGSIDSGFHTVGLRVNSLISTSPVGEAHFPFAEEANEEAVLRSEEVGIPTPAQMPLDVVGDIYISTDESTAGGTDDAIDFSEEFPGHQYLSIATKMRSTEKKVDERIFFKQEDVEFYQSQMHKMAQAAAKSVEVGSDDSSETNFGTTRVTLERTRKSSVPFNWSQEEVYTTFPVSRDGIHLSKARQESRINFFPAKYIRRLQDTASKPTVAARTIDYIETRHGALKKPEEENKDKKENLPGPSGSMAKYGHKDWRRYRFLINLERYNVPIARTGSTPCVMATIPNLMKELIQLIRMRKTIECVLATGATPTLNWQLARYLNCSDDEARATVHSIRKLGILKSADWSKMKDYYKTGCSKFWLRKTIPSCNTICSEILDPMLFIREYYEIPPPIPPPMIRSHWSRSGIPILNGNMSESAEWYNTIDPRWQPKLWERVRSNPSTNGYFFEGQTSNSVSKRLLNLADEEGVEDDSVSAPEVKKMKLR